MKKELISPLLTLIAMILIIINRVLDSNRTGDIIAYLAFLVAGLSIFQIVTLFKNSK